MGSSYSCVLIIRKSRLCEDTLERFLDTITDALLPNLVGIHKESNTEFTEGGAISNVQEWVQYRER